MACAGRPCAPALAPAPGIASSGAATPPAAVFAPASTVQYGLLILIVVLVVIIIAGPIVIFTIRRVRRPTAAEVVLTQEAARRAGKAGGKLPYQTVQGIIVEQPNASYHLATYGEAVDYSKRGRSHTNDEVSCSKRAPTPGIGSAHPSRSGLEGGVGQPSQPAVDDVGGSGSGPRSESSGGLGQSVSDSETKNQDLIIEMHRI